VTPDDITDAILAELEDATGTLIGLGGLSSTWVLDELREMWIDAQAQAARAYEHWHRHPGRDAYVLYRAAQDRADAGQDALHLRAAWQKRSREASRAGAPLRPPGR
jgi:hypothetical protein